MNKDHAFKKISAEDLHGKLEAGEDIILIDTLPNSYFQQVHLPGAENACVFEVVFLENVSNITNDRACEIVVYGSSEKSMDAVTAADKLVRAGFENVTALEGGLKRWRALGYDLEGDQTESAGVEEGPPALEDRSYEVDIEQSVLEWTGRNPNTTHYGTVQLAEGRIIVENGRIAGHVTIDMNAIKNINLELVRD